MIKESDMNTYSDKETVEKQLGELFDKARKLYPDIDKQIESYNAASASIESVQDYLNLTMQTLVETSNNHVILF